MSTGIAVSGQQALATAERLLDPENVFAAAPAPADASLASGLAGTALLHARLSTTDPVFATAATRHWETGAAHTRRYGGTSAGTFNSPGGLAASLIIGSQYLPDPDSQRTVTTRAAQWLSARALDLARRHEVGTHGQYVRSASIACTQGARSDYTLPVHELPRRSVDQRGRP